jgi:signal transduction histidine kinase
MVSSRPLMIAALLPALVLVIADVVLSVQFFPRDGAWSPELVVLAVALSSARILALAVGWSWWWRAPANPTGLLLFAAGICSCLWQMSWCWPHASWVTVLNSFGAAMLLLLTIVVLGWPTGRPGRRLTTVAVACVTSGVLLGVVGTAFHRSATPSAEWPDPPFALWSVPAVWWVLDAIRALACWALPAAVLVIWLIRRRRAVPPAVRPLLTPITIAGVLAAGSITVELVGLYLFPTGGGFANWAGGWVGMAFFLGDYCSPGFVAIGVLVAGNRRRRAVAVGRDRLLVDLQSATPIVTPSAAAAAIIGDPTASVRYLRPDGSWVDSSGSPLDDPTGDRWMLPVVDADGELMAGIDVDGARPVPPLLADLAGSTIALRAANERAAALADSRRQEVRLRSRELVAATDQGRIDLERNLHDGAQQLLVGLALTVGLRARQAGPAATRPDRADIDEVIRQVRQTRQDALALVDSSTPAALTLGLAGALSALAAGSPLSTTVQVLGDLPAADPAAGGLYLAATELVTNAAKHSGATRVDIGLTVAPSEVRLVVTDNGKGGVRGVPITVADRVRTMGGQARLDSPTGIGTTVQIEVAQARAAGAAG